MQLHLSVRQPLFLVSSTPHFMTSDRASLQMHARCDVFLCVCKQTGPLAASATALFQACKSLSSVGNPPVGTALGDSGLELEDAASVQGCIVLAAAAGPAIISAGDFLASAGGAMGAHGLNMQKSGGTYFDAGERLWRAGAAIAEAGEAMESSGMAIENVK